MADLPVAVVDVGSYTCKAGFAVPEKDPIVLQRAAVLRKVRTTPEPAIRHYPLSPIPPCEGSAGRSTWLGF